MPERDIPGRDNPNHESQENQYPRTLDELIKQVDGLFTPFGSSLDLHSFTVAVDNSPEGQMVHLTAKQGSGTELVFTKLGTTRFVDFGPHLSRSRDGESATNTSVMISLQSHPENSGDIEIAELVIPLQPTDVKPDTLYGTPAHRQVRHSGTAPFSDEDQNIVNSATKMLREFVHKAQEEASTQRST